MDLNIEVAKLQYNDYVIIINAAPPEEVPSDDMCTEGSSLSCLTCHNEDSIEDCITNGHWKVCTQSNVSSSNIK